MFHFLYSSVHGARAARRIESKMNKLISPSAAHTPTPWEWDGTPWNYDNTQESPWIISDSEAVLTGEIKCSHANAEFIVRACNAHDDLLAACKEAYDFVVTQSRGPRDEADCLSVRLITVI